MSKTHFRIAYFNRWNHPDGLKQLQNDPGIDLILLRSDTPPDENWNLLAQAHGYHISSARDDIPSDFHVTVPFLSRCPDLLAVATNGAGYDTVDIKACSEASVLVMNQAGGNREAVAEHTLAMMIALSKNMIESDQAMRRDRHWNRNDFIGHDIFGKTLGIIGLGNIGSRVAQICLNAFDMQVLAYDPYLTQQQFSQRGAQPVSLAELLKQADFVSLHCPRTAATEGMIGAEEFALMRTDAYFITTARGGIHDENALYQTLLEGRLAGAGLDVWAVEPAPLDHPLLRLSNVIATPHTAGVTHEGRRNVAVGAADQWQALAQGAQPPRILNKEIWPRISQRFMAHTD